MATDSAVVTELKDVLVEYDLGELDDYEKNERGFVNTAYAICLRAGGERRRYFLRKYKRGIEEQELIFEHSLIEHLLESGSPVARIHHTRAGQTYLHRFEGEDDATGVFYTIFDYLPGEDRFTWVNPVLTEQQLASSAAVLAQIHGAGLSLAPRGKRVEPRILELLPVIAETWRGCPAKSKGSLFDARVAEHLQRISLNIAATRAVLEEPGIRSLPEMIVHCDYHPGNLKFTGDAVTGVFDFDWSKVDFRLFDLGLALWYFCTSWQKTEDGSLRLDWVQTFLRAYLDRLAAAAPALAFTPAEAHYLPVMINAGSLYVLHWTILDYFAKDVDPAEYLVFLDHSLNFATWYDQPGNCQALGAVISSVISPAV